MTVAGEELERLDAYWRAANYLSVGQIYLLDNPLLREPLQPEHVKPRLLGHCGTDPGLNLVYAHLNRAIRARDLDAIYISGPGPRRARHRRERLPRGHLQRALPARRPRRGRPAGAVPPVLVPGRHPEPRRARDAGLDPRGRRARLLARARVRRGVRQPGPARRAASSATARPRPARSRRAGTRTSSSTRETDGAVLPILHLNGYKIANPTVLARIPEAELVALLEGYGYRPLLVTGGFDGEDPLAVHQRFAAALDEALDEIAEIQRARATATDAAALADDRPAHAEGLDGPEGGRRPAGRGHVALAPGADRRGARQRRAPAPARGVDAQLPARGALRRRRRAGAGARSSSRRAASGG